MARRISPKLEWLRPYLFIGLLYLPKKHKIVRIGSWSVGSSRGKNVAGAIFQDRLGDGHRIWLHTHLNKNTPYSKIEILNTLAHEMAHTVDWKHTPKHKKLESRITNAFMNYLQKEGYVSEEEEMR